MHTLRYTRGLSGFVFLTVAGLLSPTVLVFGQGRPSPDVGPDSKPSEGATWQVRDAEQAKASAQRFAGLSQGMSASARLVTIEGDKTPFLADKINGREVWRHFRETGPGWEELTVPLSDFAGQTVLLSLAIDAGVAGHNTSCDGSLWGDVTLMTEG